MCFHPCLLLCLICQFLLMFKLRLKHPVLFSVVIHMLPYFIDCSNHLLALLTKLLPDSGHCGSYLLALRTQLLPQSGVPVHKC